MKTSFVVAVLSGIVALGYCISVPPIGGYGTGGTGRSPGGIPGGLTDADTNDLTIVRMARYAVSELGREYSLQSVNSAQTQVVSGFLYHLNISVLKRRPSSQNKSYTCDVKVHEQSWLNFLDLIEFHCTNA